MSFDVQGACSVSGTHRVVVLACDRFAGAVRLQGQGEAGAEGAGEQRRLWAVGEE